jgi:hypothetical protein
MGRLPGWGVPEVAINDFLKARFRGTTSSSKPVDRRYQVVVVVSAPL